MTGHDRRGHTVSKSDIIRASGHDHCYRPISQTVFMLSIAINRAEHVCATVIVKHNYMLMCNHKIVINIMLCLLNSTGHPSARPEVRGTADVDGGAYLLFLPHPRTPSRLSSFRNGQNVW